MKIVLAGAGGVIGKALIPMLVEAGHDVIGLIRNPSHAVELSNMGVSTECLNVYDREAVFTALREAVYCCDPSAHLVKCPELRRQCQNPQGRNP